MKSKAPKDLSTLVIEYRVRSGQEEAATGKRHAIEQWLEALLAAKGLGSCSGGGIGLGTGVMEVFCEVTSFAKARTAIEREIATTPFAGYARIRKVAPEKPTRGPAPAPGYAKGDCLIARLPQPGPFAKDLFSAAYVIDVEPDSPNVVILDLDCLSPTRPAIGDFARLQPLVLTHNQWEGDVAITVTTRDPAQDELVEVAGNLELQWPGIEIGLDRGVWANWKGPRDADLDDLAREAGEFDPDSPARYLRYGDWAPGLQARLQAEWNAGKR